MLTYDIAGLRFGIHSSNPSKLKRFKPFLSSSDKNTDVRINLLMVDSLVAPVKIMLSSDEIVCSSSIFEDHASLYVYLKKTKRVEYKIDTDNNWSNITITCDKLSPSVEKALCTHLGNLIISNRIILNDGVTIHASSINCEGKGIVFTAPSGTGKSTHAAMWKKHHNAAILNDDCPIIRYIDGKSHVYGTPWSGSSDKSINANAPLCAIVILEKGKENSIRKLTDEESVSMILPRIFLPYHNTQSLDMAISHTEKIIKSVPKYLLKCRPDYAAMELVYKCTI